MISANSALRPGSKNAARESLRGLLPYSVDDDVCERWAVARAREECWPGHLRRGTYQTLVFGVVKGDKSEVAALGKLGDGKATDGDTVYEIGSVTKTFTATWARPCSLDA